MPRSLPPQQLLKQRHTTRLMSLYLPFIHRRIYIARLSVFLFSKSVTRPVLVAVVVEVTN